jgi:hypothetical protein
MDDTTRDESRRKMLDGPGSGKGPYSSMSPAPLTPERRRWSLDGDEAYNRDPCDFAHMPPLELSEETRAALRARGLDPDAIAAELDELVRRNIPRGM